MAKTTARRWTLLYSFVAHEISSVAAGAFFGVLAAALLHFFLYDTAFRVFLKAHYSNDLKLLDDPRAYLTYCTFGAVALVAFMSIRIWSVSRRGLRSWFLGVTSGLRSLCFVFTFTIFGLHSISLSSRVIAELVAICAALCIASILHIRATDAREQAPTEKDVQVSTEVKSRAGSEVTESDDPIDTWEEDTLGRAALVESLAVKLLISKAPVIALFGDFGSGKTSILNLLRKHLTGKAIIVSFSTWLPGSQETLTSYLMADIASESQKQFIVPGLRRSTRRLANALGESVPLLKGLPQLFPPTTQKDDIDGLRESLVRLPRRVIVLLDELDRMEKDELNTLLKVVRGISSLPNLSFVCAAERKTLMETVRGNSDTESNTYFEKFFPVSMPVPKPDAHALQYAGIERLAKSFNARHWFNSQQEEERFRTQMAQIWERRIAPFCGTLRAIGLLANDVGMAAAPLLREVDSIDLVLVELLRRFQPSVYDLVARSGVVLTGGESIVRGGSYHSKEEIKREQDRFSQELKGLFEDQSELDRVRGVLGELFPTFAKAENLTWAERPKRKENQEEDNRIADPSMFPAFFRYELPSAIFSTVELENFVDKSKESQSRLERKHLLEEKLRSMEKGSLKKDDLFRKLSESAKTVELGVARAWVSAVLTLADDLTYDTFSAFGEAGHVLRMIINVAQRISLPERIHFLSECIIEATDDTIAVRVLNLLTNQQSDGYQGVSFAQLYPAFIKRMRTRYGRTVDAQSVDLTKSDRDSFNLWGFEDLSKHGLSFDPEDRAIQYDFWKRHIGNTKSRLIRAFNDYLMPLGIYEVDPQIVVVRRIDIETLRNLFKQLPDDPGMEAVPAKDVRRMQKFLDGKYQRGIGIDLASGEPDEPFEEVDVEPDGTSNVETTLD
jgi:hypothetical protein